MAVFSRCVVAVEFGYAYSFKEKRTFCSKITDNGGTVSMIITKKCTHLVLVRPEEQRDLYKCSTAQKYGIPVVTSSFIDVSLDHGKLQDPEAFLAAGSTKANTFSSGRIASSKHQTASRQVKRSCPVKLSKLKVWSWQDTSGPTFDEDGYQVAKSIVLQKETVKENHYWPQKTREAHSDTQVTHSISFCVIEIHVSGAGDDSGDAYRVFCHDGTLPLTGLEKIHVLATLSASYTHLGAFKGPDQEYGTKDCRYLSTSDQALAVYSELYRLYTSQQGYTRTSQFISRHIGSPKFKLYLEDIMFSTATLPPSVAQLVESVWAEALGKLEEQLAVPVDGVTLQQVDTAEAVLLEIYETIDAAQSSESDGKSAAKLKKLSDEFYSHLPHKHPVIMNQKNLVTRLQDFCQLIRDVVTVGESAGIGESTSQAQYRALRCHIHHLDPDVPDYCMVRDLVLTPETENSGLKIHNIFSVQRSVEDSHYRADLQNIYLLHASRPQNFVGILSRGLLLPKIVVDDYGGTKSDPGMLGGGIYFSDSALTCAKYSGVCVKGRGAKRLLLVHQVALGQCKDVYTYDTDLTGPPEGYDSMHGVRATATRASDFKDEEYVIYDQKQQRLCYLVEFSLQEDCTDTKDISANLAYSSVSCDTTDQVDNMKLTSQEITLDIEDVKDVSDPLGIVDMGLVSSTNKPMPLKAVHVRARMLDLVAQVAVLQSYHNDTDVAVEAKYVFAVDEQAVISGFEAFINDKHIIGEVKEKEIARREYSEAVSHGHGAYMMEQQAETPDVSIISIGNLPPKATVLIKITYVTELQVEGESIVFRLPSGVAPWRQNQALSGATQHETSTLKVDGAAQESSIHVAIEMPFVIRKIESPSHKVKVKKTETKAAIGLEAGETLDKTFLLLVCLAEIHVPRMWVESHSTLQDSRACMLAFYPEFEAASSSSYEVVFVLDMSDSMKGSTMVDAMKVLLLNLYHLPTICHFNVIIFGTTFLELFPSSQPKTQTNYNAAKAFLKDFGMTMGNTEAFRPLQAYYLLPPTEGALRNLFLISDGYLNNEDSILHSASVNSSHTRLFTLGVGSTANRHLLNRLAQVGAGAFEFFESTFKSKWECRVKRQLRKASQPVLTSVSVMWQQYDCETAPVQAPREIPAIFNGSRLVVYGFVPNCTQATLKAVVENKEVSTMVTTSDLRITTGKVLHQLTARALIRDWEDGTLNADRLHHVLMKKKWKNFIINLSKKFSIVSQFTSFVAIEERAEEERPGGNGVTMEDLLAQEDTDPLTYMGWEGEKFSKETMGEKEGQGKEVPSENYGDVESTLRQHMDRAQEEALKDKISARDIFQALYKQAETDLPPTHPLKLQIALNYGAFLKTQKRPDEAVQICEETFDGAISELDNLSEQSYEESTNLLSCLKEAVLFGTNDISSEEDEECDDHRFKEHWLCDLEDEREETRQQLQQNVAADSCETYCDADTKGEIENIRTEISIVKNILTENIDKVLERSADLAVGGRGGRGWGGTRVLKFRKKRIEAHHMEKESYVGDPFRVETKDICETAQDRPAGVTYEEDFTRPGEEERGGEWEQEQEADNRSSLTQFKVRRPLDEIDGHSGRNRQDIFPEVMISKNAQIIDFKPKIIGSRKIKKKSATDISAELPITRERKGFSYRTAKHRVAEEEQPLGSLLPEVIAGTAPKPESLEEDLSPSSLFDTLPSEGQFELQMYKATSPSVCLMEEEALKDSPRMLGLQEQAGSDLLDMTTIETPQSLTPVDEFMFGQPYGQQWRRFDVKVGVEGPYEKQDCSTGAVFGRPPLKGSSGGLLGGPPVAQPSSAGGLFGGPPVTQPSSTGGLFEGPPVTQPSSTGGLFGGPPVTQPSSTGGLSGGPPVTQPRSAGELFGGPPVTQPSSAGGLFGGPPVTQPSSTGGLFEGPPVTQPSSTGGLFGGPPVTQPSSTGGLSGGPPVTQPSSTGGLFGGPPVTQPSSTGGLSGGPPVTQPSSTGGLFGGPPVTQPSSTGGLSGGPPVTQPRSAGELFGGPPVTQPSSAGGLFGGPPVTQPSSTGGLFGGPPVTQPSPAGELFGGPPVTQPRSAGGLFGGPPAAQPSSTGGLFGRPPVTQPSSTGGLFEGPPVTQPSSTGGLFRGPPVTQPSSTGGLFGGPPVTQPSFTGGLFSGLPAAQPSSTGGLFGGPLAAQPSSTGGLFGRPSVTQQSSSEGLFGGPPVPQPSSSEGLFGGPPVTQPCSTGGLFGRPPVTQPGSTGGLFGRPSVTQPSSAGGLFGGPPVTQPSSFGGLFGRQPMTQPSSTGGLFGRPSVTQPSSTGGLFGGPPVTQPSFTGGLFSGSPPAQPSSTGGLFGRPPATQPSSAGGLFGGPPVTQPRSTGGLFGGPPVTQLSSTGGMFGGTPATLPSSTGGLFGGPPVTQPSSMEGLFGRPPVTQLSSTGGMSAGPPATQLSSTGGLFGGPPVTQPSSMEGLFGGPPVTQPSSTGGMFGGPPATQPSSTGRLFGGPPVTQPSSMEGLFGGPPVTQPSSTGGLFGGPPATQPSSTGGLFGGPPVTQPSSTGGMFGCAPVTELSSDGGPFGVPSVKQPSSTVGGFRGFSFMVPPVTQKMQSTGFGAIPETGFGAKPVCSFGLTATTAFGARPAAALRTSGATGFGVGAAAFGGTTRTVLGAVPATAFFGGNENSFGASQRFAFGARPTTAYGVAPAAGFGATLGNGFGEVESPTYTCTSTPVEQSRVVSPDCSFGIGAVESPTYTGTSTSTEQSRVVSRDCSWLSFEEHRAITYDAIRKQPGPEEFKRHERSFRPAAKHIEGAKPVQDDPEWLQCDYAETDFEKRPGGDADKEQTSVVKEAHEATDHEELTGREEEGLNLDDTDHAELTGEEEDGSNLDDTDHAELTGAEEEGSNLDDTDHAELTGEEEEGSNLDDTDHAELTGEEEEGSNLDDTDHAELTGEEEEGSNLDDTDHAELTGAEEEGSNLDDTDHAELTGEEEEGSNLDDTDHAELTGEEEEGSNLDDTDHAELIGEEENELKFSHMDQEKLRGGEEERGQNEDEERSPSAPTGLTEEVLESLLDMQFTSFEGSRWEVMLDELLGLPVSGCKQALVEAGLPSLGENVSNEVYRLVATLIVLLWLRRFESQVMGLQQVLGLFKSPKRGSDELLTWSREWTLTGVQHRGLTEAVLRCEEMMKKHAMVCMVLELAANWEAAVFKLLRN